MTSFIGFIPTPIEQIEGFLDLVSLSVSDVVYDLGSGDGRLLFAALANGAGKAVGVELNAELVRESTEAARSKGLKNRVTFLEADVMDVKLAEASVVFCYLSVKASPALKLKFYEELRPGAKVIMEMFPVPGWKPARTASKEGKRFYLYNMPPESLKEEVARDPLIDYLNYSSSPTEES
jgi:SAM-dependent methyltransferase